MNVLKRILILLILFIANYNYAQLGFCNGSKGQPIFSENFGNGTIYGPALATGITNYNFINGTPNDGQYTLFYRTNLYSTWHYSLDHTPDATNGINGKALIVNADASTSGDFYKRSISGLCINTTFEFSAWLLNVYSPNSGYCGAGEIPINVRFEIWNDTETVLLGSGNTGNIIGTATPIWQQFALVFTTGTQTSVVLKMKNNGLGGCGNDLAIDDIEFRSCGDLTTITSSSSIGNSYSTCNGPVSLQFQANTGGSNIHFYQWQSSYDGVNFTDILGANLSTYTTPNISTTTYFRTKVAQDVANLGNDFCSTISNIFTVSIFSTPNNCISNGDKTICSNETIPALTVTSDANISVNWYDASSGGNLVQSNSNSYIPTNTGTFYAEGYNVSSNCTSTVRTPVTLAIVALPTASISGTTTICTGNSTTINFSGTPNATIIYTIDNGSNQSITLDSTGIATFMTPVLTTDTIYTLVNVVSSALSSCVTNLSNSITISVVTSPSVTISANPLKVCLNGTSVVNFSGTPTAIVNYSQNGGTNQSVILDSSGNATITTSNLISETTFQLVNVSLNGSNCLQTLSDSVTITINPTPTASFSGITDYCSNETIAINLSSDILGTTFSWTVNQNGISGAISGNGSLINQILSVANNDEIATYFVTPSYNGCDGTTLQINVLVHASPTPTITDGTICLNNSSLPSSQYYVLDTNLNASEYSFQWFFNGSNAATSGNTFDAYQIGNYGVIATNLNTGCVSNLVSATVSATSQGQSLEINQSEMFSENPTITVSVVGGNGPFLYQLDALGFQNSNIFTNVSSGNHTISVVDASFCTNLFETVTVINYPHFFTPNGDGVNDSWNIIGLRDNSTILIFDRFGKFIKQIKTNGAGWDGTYDGKLITADDYWFTIDYVENTIQKVFKAHFALKR